MGAGVNVDLGAGTASDGQGGTDTISNIERARGSQFNDVLTGDAGDNVLEGLNGSDRLIGGGGNDILDGGSLASAIHSNAFDSADYRTATAGVTVSRSAASSVTGDASVGTDTLIGIEKVFGSDFADTYIADLSYVSDSFTPLNFFEGGGGDDVITGNGATRLDYGFATGAITVDFIAGTASGDASVGTDSFTGVNWIVGSGFGDTVFGSDAVEGDIFRGLAGDDFFDGRGGGADRADYAFGGSSGVIVDLSAGTATDNYGNTDTLVNVENVRGSVFFGDSITGDANANEINGEGGDDTLTGGGGDDLFIFENGTGDDVITDFTAGAGSDDVIDVSDFGFTDLADLLAATNDSGADTVITLDGDDSLTLIGVQEADLHEDDFLL